MWVASLAAVIWPVLGLVSAILLLWGWGFSWVDLGLLLGMYFVTPTPSAEDMAAHVGDAVKPALVALRDRLAEIAWDKASIAAAIKATLGETIDLERWDKGWARLYESWPCERVDRGFRAHMTERRQLLVELGDEIGGDRMRGFLRHEARS